MAEALGVAASALAVIELSAKVVKTCSQYTKDVANARRDIRRLRKEVKSLGAVAKSVQELSENTPRHKVTTIKKMQPVLDEGRMRLEELQAILEPGIRERFMSQIGLRAIRWPLSSKDVGKALSDLARLMQAISIAISVDQATLLLSLEQKNALAKLPIAENAVYDSHADEHNSKCLENTRTEVLQEIRGWVRNPSSKAVYWLNGMAGTGKSTISRTIADKFSKDDSRRVRLGATFFFKRGEGDRGNISKFFTTITSQLVRQLPEIAGHVQAAIEADPSLISKSMRIQFETLIVDPVAKISSIGRSGRIILFVIDALDECEREKDVQLLIELLSGIPRAMAVQLKFFLTSRPELPIRLGFHSVNGRYRDFVLHEVAEPIIEHDLKVYLRHELERIRLTFNQGLPEERRLPPDWPKRTDIGSLVQMATPLFIFAATICRFVADRKGGNPEKKLRRVLEFRSAQGSKLVATYMPVLEQMTMDIPPEEKGEILLQFQQIVGSIVVLADPLGSKPLSRLLNIETNEILELLDFLHSVLQVPSSTEQPIRLLHLSFRDFLINPARQKNRFWVDEKQVHQQLAEKCLRVLNSSLNNDICNVKAPGTFASSISASRIRTSIPPELQYACRFWAYHLRKSSSPDLNAAETWEFLRSHFLHWLEALSWMGRLPESFGIVRTLQSISHIKRDKKMIKFLKDSVRFLQAAYSSIQIAPLQAYSSSLVFAPIKSIVRRMYEGDMPDYTVLGNRMPSSWDDRLQTFEVYSDTIVRIAFLFDGKLLGAAFGDGTMILLEADTGEHRLRVKGRRFAPYAPAFSPDGKLFASVMGSSTVTLWHTETGKALRTFNGHKDAVDRIVFSPDSNFMASLSRDGTVFLQAVETGKWRQPLEISSEPFCSDSIWSLAISPDNKVMALTSVEHTIVLWETQTCERRQILRGHSDWIHSIAFSSDSKLLASASEDQTIILWDIRTAEKQRILKAHAGPVNMVAFSLDGDLLASASDDGTVILWQTKTGQQQQSLEGHDSLVSSIAFSSNGKLLASASCDGNVVLWAAETGTRLQTFEGSADDENHISFSPDNKRLAATSGHGSISVWATDTVECGKMPKKLSNSDSVIITFSPDSKLLVTLGVGRSVILWRVDTGEQVQTLRGQFGSSSSIALSPDNRFLASETTDQTVTLWTVDTGERWQTLEGRTGRVYKIGFSPDGKTLATVKYDARSHGHIVVLWATDTGTRCQTLGQLSRKITSIAFSPNGKSLALALDDRTVALWSPDTGESRQISERHLITFTEILFTSDSKLVAMDSGRAVVLWVAETDEGQQMPLELGHYGSGVDFDQSALSMTVAQSSLPLVSISQGNSDDLIDVGPGISQDDCWICLNGEPILWLPPEYRAVFWTVSRHHSTIAFQCKSGRVFIVRLKSLCIE